MGKVQFSLFFMVLFLLGPHCTKAQADCVLGVGLTNDTTLIEVFQMNGAQREALIRSSAELQYRNELLQTRLNNFRERHKALGADDLGKLAKEYRIMMDSMAAIQEMMDKRILVLFNSKQYELYQGLCKQASRSPYVVTTRVYRDSTDNGN